MVFAKLVKYFDKCCSAKSDDWKLKKFTKFLERSDLMFFINNCKDYCSLCGLIIRFNEKYVNFSYPTISEFV